MGVDIITSSARLLLFFWIPAVSILGIVWHVLLTRDMAFVDFGRDLNQETLRAMSLLRFFIPLIVVVLVTGLFLTPLYIKLHPQLADFLEKDSLNSIKQFIQFPYNFVLPVMEWPLTIFFNVAVGAAIYLVGGFLIWVGQRRLYGR